jgi:para-nitrobenzyl esterase
MDGYWSRFAASGDRDGGGAVAWPLYDPTADTVLQLDDAPVAASGIRTTQCGFWDQTLGR